MTQRLTSEQEAQARARLAAATPGPWSADLQPGDCTVWGPDGQRGGPDTHHGPTPVFLMNLADGVAQPVAFDLNEATNAEFIANAPTDIAALLAEIDALRADLAGAEERGRQRERADVLQRLDNELADDEQGESWQLMERHDFQYLRTSIARGDHVRTGTTPPDAGESGA